MKKSLEFSLTVTIACLLSLSTSQIANARQEGGEPQMSPEAQAEMAAWMKLAQPGEHHKHLAPFEGKWKSQIKMWMGPGSEPMDNEAVAEAHWVMDGRFLEWTYSGEFAGSPYLGRGFDGYNNGDERYETVLFDNFGTLFVLYKGACSDDGKSRTMNGEFSNPMTGGKIQQRGVYTWIDDDHFKYEMYTTMDDEEYKNMEMLYERQ